MDVMEVKPDADAGDTMEVKPDADAADAEAGTDVPKDADGGDAEVTPPVCPVTPVCTLAAKRCGPNGGVQTCITVAGCPDWSAEVACGGHQACTAGVCGCVPEARCTVEGPFCDTNGNLGACSKDGACFFVSTAPAACAAGKVCSGAAGAGACACAPTACGGAASVTCTDAATLRTCAADATSGCFVPTNSSCGAVKTCQTNACACPGIGTHVNEGCTLQSPAICEGANILTCTHDGDSGCNVWQITDQCNVDASTRANNPHPANLTCNKGATGTGPAACQCKPNGTTTVYVDPVVGNDDFNSTNRFPTGILDPPICRFATLTHGMAVTGVTQVIAINDNVGTTPVSFDNEPPTGPAATLTVKDNVILKSSDNTPAHYIINLKAVSLGIQLGSESVIQGFTLNAGAVSSSAISFPSTAHATVDTVVINGGGTVSHGINVGVGTGTADINAVTIDKTSGSAIDINAKSATISGSKASNAAIGLRVLAGTVTVTNSIFDKNQVGITAESSPLAIVNLAGTAITNSGTTGISVNQGVIVADQPTTIDSGKTGNGIVAANGAHVTLTGTSVTNNNVGITSSGNTTVVSITGGAHIDSNKSNGIVASNLGTSLAPGLTVGGSSSVGLNGGDGIVLTGAIATIAGADIHENVNGIHVASPSGSAVIQIGLPGMTTTVQKNSAVGILADQAPATTAGNASSLFVDTASVDSNGGTGIDLTAAASVTVFATVRNSSITNNHGSGIVVAGGAAPLGHTDTSFNGNQVSSNGFSVLTDNVGGILFAQTSTLSGFVGNSVHDNNGNQVAFNNLQTPDAARGITATWKISAPSCEVPPSNRIYHYAAGLVGLRVAGPVSVDATNVHWQNTNPIAGTDVSNTGMISFDPPHCAAAP